jgi:hypothetical protein
MKGTSDFLVRMTSSARTAWVVTAVLIAVILLAVTGVIGFHPRWTSVSGQTDYSTERLRLVDADSSQPLHMRLEGQYPGPLQDTTIQRWHDPVDGTVCYIYLPIAVARSAGPHGLVQYGSANIGSISCIHP